MITVVGMGRKHGDLTQDGQKAIEQADVVVVKSQYTHAAETVASIRSDVVFCDDLYEQEENMNKAIINRLQSFKNKKVAFCVVGDGTDDCIVQQLDNPKIIYGVSLYTPVVGNCMPTGTVIYTAQDLLDTERILPLPTIVKGVDDNLIIGDVRVKLGEAFDDDCEVVITCGNKIKKISLDELSQQRCDYQTTLFISPKAIEKKEVFDYYDCVNAMKILRGENGCPWDKAQTHKSIIKNVIEEAYELANALEQENIDNIIEELGDLLMQVIFHIEIAQRENEFEEGQVYTALCRKLIDRHPHVFGEIKVHNPDESLDVWNAQKMKEHKIKSLSENVMDVPRNMSALMRSQKVQSRASKGSFDFKNIQQIVDKLHEELQEFLNATGEDRQMEGGDLLFVVVNLLRFSEVDSETALLLSTEKFTRRVVECERILANNKQRLPDLTGEQFDEIWAEAKRNVG